MEEDPHGLARFRDAQNSGATHEHALVALRAGRKTGNWMWFGCPRVGGGGKKRR
ncbi:MAG: DUF1810 family protein, partial [Solirubrobacteraceae bacterium]